MYIFILTIFYTICIIFFAPEIRRILNLLFMKIIGYTLILIKKINILIDKLAINNSEKIKLIVDNNSVYNSLNDLKKKTKYKDTKYKSILIKYFINKKEFYIVYSNCYIDDIKFPIYTYNELEKKNAFDQTDEDIILVEIETSDNIDDKIKLEILKIIKKFSGPKGTFYEDKNLIIKKNDIINYINNILNIELNLNTNLKLIYSTGLEKII